VDKNFSTPYYQPGIDQDVAYLFSAPGQEEEKAGRPAAGKTGMHLTLLITILRYRGLTFLPFREQATVDNAWPHILFEKKSGRTEGTDKEILAPENLERLASEIGHIEKWLVCFGAKAHLAASKTKEMGLLKNNCRLVKSKHLSPRVINFIDKDIHGEALDGGGFWNLCRRLEVLAEELYVQFKG
jgi:hypothetical protein